MLIFPHPSHLLVRSQVGNQALSSCVKHPLQKQVTSVRLGLWQLQTTGQLWIELRVHPIAAVCEDHLQHPKRPPITDSVTCKSKPQQLCRPSHQCCLQSPLKTTWKWAYSQHYFNARSQKISDWEIQKAFAKIPLETDSTLRVPRAATKLIQNTGCENILSTFSMKIWKHHYIIQ